MYIWSENLWHGFEWNVNFCLFEILVNLQKTCAEMGTNAKCYKNCCY
jgi:hypothetical protein